MRKYLWAMALCGAAGMAVPSWAQERSKSLFGLGRSSKPAAATADKPAKPSKLKNYGELFDDADKPVAKTPNDDAPSLDTVQKIAAKRDDSSDFATGAASVDRNDQSATKSATATKTLTAPKSTVVAKTSLLDDTDDFDKLDELDALEEAAEQEEFARQATSKKSVAARPVPPTAAPAEGRVVVRPSVVAKPQGAARPDFKTASLDKPAWATEADHEEAVTEEPVVAKPQVVVSKKPAPPAPPVKPVRPVPALADKPSFNPTATRTPVVKATPTRTTISRLNTPINVATDVEESTPVTEEITTVSASVPEQSERAVPSNSRLTVTRSTSRAAKLPEAEVAEPLNLDNTYTAPTAKESATVTQAPSVTVEWRSKGAITVGQESACDLIVKNSGTATAQDVQVEASFPPNVRLVSANPKPESTSDLVWAFDEIAPGAEKIVHVSFIPVERGEVAAKANVRFTGAASTSFAVTEPLLAVKLEGVSEVMVGESASQTLIISNPGTGTAANVKVEAIIPAGLEHSRGERLSMDLGNLAPGENRPIRLALTAVAGGRQLIEIHASADNGLVKSAASEVTVIAPSLAASIEGPSLRYLGRHATYTLHVANDGAAATDNVRVMHKIPEGFEFISADRGAQYDPQNRMLNWFVGRLDRGADSRLSVVLNSKSTGEYTHFIRATSEHGAISDADVTTRIEGAASLVVNVKDLDDPVEVGVETAYEVVVKNEGTAPAKNVGLTCELPAGMEFLTASGATSHANDKELVVFQPVTELAAGKTVTYQVKVKGTLSGNMRFRTKVSSESLVEPLAAEEITKIYGE